jgi:hypothetical protein
MNDLPQFWNKPLGIRYWFDHGLHYADHADLYDDTIFILMDPDQFLWRPFTHTFLQHDVVWSPGPRLHTTVAHGHPMAQRYSYLRFTHKRLFNTTYRLAMYHYSRAAVRASPIRKLSKKDLTAHYLAGPPYLATGRE